MSRILRIARRAGLAASALLAASVLISAGDTKTNPYIDDLERRGFFIRVKMNDLADGSSYWLQSDSGIVFESQELGIVTTFDTKEPLRIEPVSVNSAPAYYRIVLKEFEPHERRRAELYAETVTREMGLRAEVIDTPFRRPWTLKAPPKGAKVAVTVGKFVNKALADYGLAMMPSGSEEAPPRVMLDRSRPFHGKLRIFDGSGKFVGESFAEAVARAAAPDGKLSVAQADSSSSAPPAKMGGIAFRGDLHLFDAGNGKLLPVSVVSLEQYLASVVPAEIGDFAPPEALKAQAVAARSEALHKLHEGSRFNDDRYDFVSSQQDQVYKGAGVEDPKVTKAVRETWGEVLVSGDEVIDAVYSHSCGGISANAEDVWPGQSYTYLKSVVDRVQWTGPSDLSLERATEQWLQTEQDVYCNNHQKDFPEYADPFFRWKKTFTGETLSERLRDRGYDVGTLTWIEVTKRAASGRAVEVELRGTANTFKVANGDTIRTLLGNINSTLFTVAISMNDDAVGAATFHGAGYGHGVGMCQMGAFMMARRGFDYRKILPHYFEGVEIVKIY